MSARADSGRARAGTMGAAGGTSSCGSMVSGVVGRGSRSMSAGAASVGGVGHGGRRIATSGGAQDVVGEETINLDGEQEGADEGFAPDPKMKNSKANWSEPNTKVFCELWVEQIRAGNCCKGTMSRRGYNMLVDKYYISTGLKHDKT